MWMLANYLHWWWFAVRIVWWQFRTDADARAIIRVRDGRGYEDKFAHRIFKGKMGEIFAYADTIAYVYTEKLEQEAKRQNRDPIEDWEGERVLYVVANEIVCCPVEGSGKQMDESILAEFNRGDFVYQCQQSIRNPKGEGVNWGGMRWILIIALAIVIGFVVWHFVLHGHMPGTKVPIPSNTPTPSPTPSSTPIFSSLTSWLLWMVSNV